MQGLILAAGMGECSAAYCGMPAASLDTKALEEVRYSE